MMITNKVTVFYCSRLDCINLLLDEKEHSVRNVDYEIKRQKAVEQEIVSLLEMILTKKIFDTFKA